MPSSSKPTAKSERRFPRLSEGSLRAVLREVKKWQDLGLLQYQSQLEERLKLAEEEELKLAEERMKLKVLLTAYNSAPPGQRQAAVRLAFNSLRLASRKVH
jgi:hypothetical protein